MQTPSPSPALPVWLRQAKTPGAAGGAAPEGRQRVQNEPLDAVPPELKGKFARGMADMERAMKLAGDKWTEKCLKVVKDNIARCNKKCGWFDFACYNACEKVAFFL